METADNLVKILNYFEILEATGNPTMIWNYENFEFGCACNYLLDDNEITI